MNYVEELKKQGHEEGLEEGRKEGRKEGREEGREEGRLEGQVGTIESLLHAGTPWPYIESATGVDEAGLRALQQRLTASAANGADDPE